MVPAANIGKLGFRRWHERQLLEGHVWLATGLLCSVAVGVLLEAVSFDGPLLGRLATLATAFAAGLIACYAFNAYARIMVRAQRLADSSSCARCVEALYSVHSRAGRFFFFCFFRTVRPAS